MLNFIKEKISVWERLKNTDKKIALYGMGNGADKILDWCEANGVQAAGVFASDEFVRGQVFRGFTVKKYDDIIAEFGSNILIVIAFASENADVLRRFKELAALHETVAPHLALFDEEETVSLTWLEKYEPQLQLVYDNLADDASREVFADILNYKISGKIEYLFQCESDRTGDLQTVFRFGEDETYMDLGAYNGDTVQEFLRLAGGKFKQIIAVEPDRRNCKKLQAMADEIGGGKISVQQMGIWSEKTELGFSDSGGRQSSFLLPQKKMVAVDCIDNLAAGQNITYIKMDVEGAEIQALAGGQKVISVCKPKIFIAAYHYDVDLFKLPLAIWNIAADYKIYLRKHPYIPAWEINFLAVVE